MCKMVKIVYISVTIFRFFFWASFGYQDIKFVYSQFVWGLKPNKGFITLEYSNIHYTQHHKVSVNLLCFGLHITHKI